MNDDELELLRSLNENVDGLRKDVQDEQETRGKQVTLLRVVIVAVAVLLVVGGTVNGLLLLKVSNQADQLAGNRVEDCQRGNVSRAAILAMFDAQPGAILRGIGSVAPTTRTPEQQAVVDDYLSKAQAFAANETKEERADLAPRDCSPEAVNP